MKTKFLPTMIGAILAGGMGVAQADVQVMGHIDTAVVSNDSEIDGMTVNDDVNLVCTTCSVGFKGSEDLGNGLKAIFKLDFQYDTTERNKNITDRDQWLGLKGNFGQVRVGTISTGYKSHGAMIDPLYRTAAQARDWGIQSTLHSGAGEEGEGRATNTFRYDSPSFNGLKVVAHYTLDSSEDDGEDNNPYGVGASYENGGILVFADYLTNDGDSAELTAWKLGGKYTMNNFSVFGQYEDAEVDNIDLLDYVDGAFAAGDLDLDPLGVDVNAEAEIWHLGGTYTMGNNMLYAAYAQGEHDVTAVDNSVSGNIEYDSWTIAGVHSMSKRTSVYAAYNNIEADDNVFDSDTFAVGMKHKF